jgi:hypothetical protein
MRLSIKILKYAVQRISQFFSAILYISNKGCALDIGAYRSTSRFYISSNNIILS